MDEKKFRENLAELTRIAGRQGMCISHEQLDAYFADFIEDEQQKRLIMDYLASKKISVGEKADLEELLSMEERNYLADYLESLASLPVLSKEELTEVMLSAIAGDADAIQLVMTQFLAQVTELAKLYAGQGIFMEDLVGEGNLALTSAVYELGCLDAEGDVYEEVSGFLGKAMMDAMEALINEEMEEKNTDQIIVDKVNKVADLAKELSEDLRRKVTPEEICANSELTLDDVKQAMKMSGDLIETIEME